MKYRPEHSILRQELLNGNSEINCPPGPARDNEVAAVEYIDIVFDGPPGPEGDRFVEVEESRGRSINFGEWVQRPDGYWALRTEAQAAVV